jgi:hypothetical protein
MHHTREQTDNATSLAARGRVHPWRGHLPITSVALLAILNRAIAGQTLFSRAERVFYLACEFWAAVNGRELEAHLDLDAALDAADPLHDARLAFSAIGAGRIVAVLRHADIPAGTRAKRGRRQSIAAVEEQLLRTQDSVDVLIAEFARRYLCDELGLPVPASDAPCPITTAAIPLDELAELRGNAGCES